MKRVEDCLRPWRARLAVLLVGLAVFGLAAPQILLAQTQTPPPPLEPPANLLAKGLNGGQVDLTWQDKSSAEKGFKLQRAADRAFSKDLTSFSLLADQTAYSDQSVKQASVYYYRLQAFNDTAISDWSNSAIVLTPFLVPKSPSTLSASSSRAYQVNLIWQDNADNEAGFRVERATENTFKTNLVSFLAGANVVNCLDNTVPAGTYYYRVFAYNKTADSLPSNVVVVTVSNVLDPPPILIGPDTAAVGIDGFNNSPPVRVDRLGVNQDAFQLGFGDSRGTLDIAKGVIMLNSSKQPLMRLSFNKPNLLPAVPAGKVLLDAVDLGQAFATFSPSAKVTWTYEPAALLSTQDPKKDLQVGRWNGASWEMLAGVAVDSEKNQVTFSADHFCLFALFRPEVKPGEPFTASNLHILPPYTDPGQPVLIWAEVKNNGPDPGNYTFVLKLNNKVEDTRSVSLEVGEKVQVNFDLVDKPSGSYNVDLNGLTASMVVRPPLPTSTVPTTTSRPTLTSTTAAPTTSATVEPSPTATTPLDTPLPISKPLLWSTGFNLLLGGILLIVAAALFLVFRRR